MRPAGAVSMNVPGATQQTHHSARQVQASLAPQLVPPGAQPSQRLLPAMRRARQPPMATIPTPTAPTTLHPPQLAAPVDLNAPGAASHAPAVAGSHAGVRYLLQPRPAQGFPRQSGPSNHPATAYGLRRRTLRYAVSMVVLCRPNGRPL